MQRGAGPATTGREPRDLGDRAINIKVVTPAHTHNPAAATGHDTPVYPRAAMSPTHAKTFKTLIGFPPERRGNIPVSTGSLYLARSVEPPRGMAALPMPAIGPREAARASQGPTACNRNFHPSTRHRSA